jgi:hypothetical protein
MTTLALQSRGSGATETPRPRSSSSALSVCPVALLLALATLPGCGGGGSTAPSQLPPFASSLDFTITPMVNNGTVVEFRWVGSNASSYQLEIGTSSGASDVATFDSAGAATTFTWTAVPIGTFWAQVKGRQGTTLGASSNNVRIDSVDARQMIDALVFGRGPLTVAGNEAGPFVPDRMEGWQPGSGFTVILGESVATAFATSTDKTVQQIGPATLGAVQVSVAGRQPDPLPSPGPGEVTISMLSPQEVKDQCKCDNCVGCAWTWLRGSFIQRGRIVLSVEAQAAAAAHELGHVIGLGHIISAAGVRPPFTMGFTPDGKYAPQGQLDVLEPGTIRMLETIYGAGLTAGSTRREFEAAGFVPPESAGAASMAASGRTDRGYFVRQEGTETLVIKPFYQERGVEH